MRSVAGRGIAVFAVASLLSGTVGPLAPAEGRASAVFVDDDGLAGAGCDGTSPVPVTIDAAVAGSGPGASIKVCPGTYPERISIAGATHDGLTIQGVGTDPVLVLPPVSDAGTIPDVLAIRGADRVRIRSIRLGALTTGSCNHVDTVVRVAGGSRSVVISDVLISPIGDDTLGTCGFGVGIAVEGGATATISDSEIRDHQVAAIFVRSPDGGASILRDRIAYVHAGALPPDSCGPGVIVSAGVARVVRDMDILGGGISVVRKGVAGRIRDNHIRGGPVGILLGSGARTRVQGNTVEASCDAGIVVAGPAVSSSRETAYRARGPGRRSASPRRGLAPSRATTSRTTIRPFPTA